MARRPRIPFFVDNCVPEAVPKVLEAAKHRVVRLRDVMATDSPDAVVAAACADQGLVLVSHDRDFRQMAPRMGITRARFQSLSRVRLECREPAAAERISAALSLIEHEWLLAQADVEPRIDISIGDGIIRSHR